ncbi:hypothetical protein QQY24_16730 [Streptomyces sp. TG1A-8]|uniref:hypothetical protein n=1 Tax=Streptomyces sp. TG1A-8 TaxID=3051385 RepID=UPI00265BC5D5|nr:hypothetical protein [Streptomyces sp. TG1A-8]MDO0926984.1 hypothetical protein [Streptomyces sp. TG1A-8]
MILCLRYLSQSLVRSRRDDGADMAALGRSDIETFTQYVAHLAHTGEISAFRRTTVCRFTSRFLREIRDLGPTRPGEILADLPDDFALRRHDMDEREQIKDATQTLRKSRTVSPGMPGIRPPEPDLRLERDA